MVKTIAIEDSLHERIIRIKNRLGLRKIPEVVENITEVAEAKYGIVRVDDKQNGSRSEE